LLSNFIFDNVLTSLNCSYVFRLLLWFAFKFYLWQRSYKLSSQVLLSQQVVICFQILSLTTFLQANNTMTKNEISCDLLSNFIFDNVLTSLLENRWRIRRLWFAFKFYLWQRSYKLSAISIDCCWVVICFQILSLTTFLQVNLILIYLRTSCDLLSNFIFDNVLTRENNRRYRWASCDLLSNFIFDNVLTREKVMNDNESKLWFAFKFYLWQRSYKKLRQQMRHRYVVICFQILSLTTFLQVVERMKRSEISCDLLSNFIFDNVLTRKLAKQIHCCKLWFAFKFYLWQRSYK